MANHSNSSRKIRPREHLRQISNDYPEAWSQLDMFRRSKGGADFTDWPDWCYVPLAASYAVVSKGGTINPTLIPDVARVGALGAWRMTQTIYKFDEDLYNSITKTSPSKVPVDILYHLPEWCIYIETPGLSWHDQKLCGFFAHLEHDVNTFRSELRFLLDIDDEDSEVPVLLPQILHMSAETVAEMYDLSRSESARQMRKKGMNVIADEVMSQDPAEISRPLLPLLSLLLYLCSDKPDLGSNPPQNPSPKKTKRGWKIFPASAPNVREVGVILGQSIRVAREQTSHLESTGGRKSPVVHIRKAHWHTYYTGPKNGQRSTKLNWIPPILVGSDGKAIDTVTIKICY